MEKVLAYDRSIVAQETGYWCGPAATQVVLNGRGIRRTEADLARRMGTDTDGTDHIGLPAKVLAAEIPGVRWTTVQMHQDPPTQAQKDQLWTDLVRSIDARYGVVMNIVAPPSNYPRAVAPSTQNLAYRGGTVYHYVALMGYGIDPDGRRRVWWADSGFPPYGSWVSFRQTASLCPPKGYVAASPLAAAPAPTPAAPAPPAAAPVGSAPRFESIQLLGQSHQPRTPRRSTSFDHTGEGNASALDLARYCSNTRNQVSYHYTLRDGSWCSWCRWSAPRGACWMRTRTRSTCASPGRVRAGPGHSGSNAARTSASPAYVAVMRLPPLRHPATVITPPYRRGSGSPITPTSPLPGHRHPPRRRQPVPLGRIRRRRRRLRRATGHRQRSTPKPRAKAWIGKRLTDGETALRGPG